MATISNDPNIVNLRILLETRKLTQTEGLTQQALSSKN